MRSLMKWQVAGFAAAALIGAVWAAPARAELILDTSTSALAQGFGNVPRLLTVQFTAPPPEVACDANSGGSLIQGQAACSSSLTDTAMVNSGDVSGSNKNNLISFSAEGITNASQIRILYNPSQTGPNPQSDIYDFDLKFYNSSNGLVFTDHSGCGNNTSALTSPYLPGSCTGTSSDVLFFADTGTNLGNGGVGMVLKFNTAEINAINAACGVNFINCSTAAADAQIGFSNDGPDSFVLFNSNLAVPEPASLAIFGAALAGLGLVRRRRKTA
jgi:PEP-CTERM motif